MDWFRLWHDMPTDPKWRVIARRASGDHNEVLISEVIAVYLFVLVDASRNDTKRGETCGIVSEDIAAALDMSTATVDLILEAMQGKVLNGRTVTGWEKRQPKREDPGSTDRVRAFRERETLRNEEKRHETTDKSRLEKIRKEENREEEEEMSPEIDEAWQMLIKAADTLEMVRSEDKRDEWLLWQGFWRKLDPEQQRTAIERVTAARYPDPHYAPTLENYVKGKWREKARPPSKGNGHRDYRAEKKAAEDQQFRDGMMDLARRKGIA
jgi:hypothetical protein